MFASLVFCFVSSVALLVRADNTFLFPPAAGQNVTIGSKGVVNWTTDWGPVLLSLIAYQQAPSSAYEWVSSILLNNTLDPGSYVWTAEPIDDLPITNGSHFSIQYGIALDTNNLTPDETFNSGPPYVLDDSTATSTSQLAISSMTSSSGSKPTLLSQQPQSSPATSVNSSVTSSLSSDNGGLGSAVNISTIVGSVIGVVVGLIVLILAWFGFKKDKNGERALPEKAKEIRRNLSRRTA